jgi:hypothetical protein
MANWSEESDVGDHFAGESTRENRIGVDREDCVVTLFKRSQYHVEAPNSFFLRISLGSQIRKGIIHRYEIDIDRYSNDSDIFAAVSVAAGALAENDNDRYGADWEPEYVAKRAHEAAKELLKDLNQ